MPIHPTAVVAPECEIADGVDIGPYCVLSGRVKLGARVRLVGSVYLSGPVTIGPDTIVYPFACLGFPAQDVKFKLGDKTAGVVVGAGGILREHVTIHAATNDHTPTTIGDRAFMMVNTHVGHDGRLGNNVIMVNNSALAGHARADDHCILSGGALVHQFNRVGRLAMLSGGTAISADVPPFCIASGRNIMVGINLVGLRRNGFSREDVTKVREAYRAAFRAGLTRPEMLRTLEDLGRGCPPVMEMARFVAEAKKVCPSLERAGGHRVGGRTPEEASVEAEAPM